MEKFQQALEDARYEVSIELYPDGEHYQIYKPDYPDAHCWEVYHNPNKESEVEVDTGCDSLDEAITAMQRHHERFSMLSDERWHEYLEAVDAVCFECTYSTGMECESCMVRKSRDEHARRRNRRQDTVLRRK